MCIFDHFCYIAPIILEMEMGELVIHVIDFLIKFFLEHNGVKPNLKGILEEYSVLYLWRQIHNLKMLIVHCACRILAQNSLPDVEVDQAISKEIKKIEYMERITCSSIFSYKSIGFAVLSVDNEYEYCREQEILV